MLMLNACFCFTLVTYSHVTSLHHGGLSLCWHLLEPFFISYFLMYLFLYGNYHYLLHCHYKMSLYFKLETLL